MDGMSPEATCAFAVDSPNPVKAGMSETDMDKGSIALRSLMVIVAILNNFDHP